ncbi:MAG TPA: glycosyltransferase family 39 protein [Solirubrobacteraceae bacterium]
MSATTIPVAASERPVTAERSLETAAILAVTALALLLRLSGLSRSLFTDEAFSLALAQRSFGHMLALFGFEANGTPYPILLWPLTRLLGTGEAVLRAPALIAGTASVPALWWAARRFTSPAGAVLAAALLAINPMAVWYSQVARPYALVVLATCLAFGALPRALDGSRRRPWAGYVAAMALLAYCDILAAPLVLPAHALIAWRSGRPGLRRWLWSLLAVLACCVPLLIAAGISRSRRNALYWLPKPDKGLIQQALQEFTGGFSTVTAVRWATVLAGGLLVAAAAWSIRRRRWDGEKGTLAVVAFWGALPGPLLLGVSLVRPLFWPRYVILALPGLCLLVAIAAVWLLRTRAGRLAAISCVAVIAVAGAVADSRQRTTAQEEWAAPAAWLRADRTEGQPVILDSVITLPALGYYDSAFRAGDGALVVEEWRDRSLPRGIVGFKDPAGFGSVAAGPPSAATFASAAQRGGGSAWLVVAEAGRARQGDVRSGAAAAWARSHCRVQVRESIAVWVMRATRCVP